MEHGHAPAALQGRVIHKYKMKAIALSIILTFILAPPSYAGESICYGTTSRGCLENGVKLPVKGPNFRAYSKLASMLRRTYVHSKVRSIILSSYNDLQETYPNNKYVYGETGWPSGGRFKPHETHQNGLSVDFMVPLIREDGEPIEIRTSVFNKYGYGVDFDAEGKNGKITIDYESMAEHIYTLHKATLELGDDIYRIIFALNLQRYLFETKRGKYLKENINFNEKPSRVRHDDHYHVDFYIDCEPYDG